jgi:hypothetical protein
LKEKIERERFLIPCGPLQRIKLFLELGGKKSFVPTLTHSEEEERGAFVHSW